jgi:hypothetical protein
MSDKKVSEAGENHLSEDARKNREKWNASSDEYERHHAHVLTGDKKRSE